MAELADAADSKSADLRVLGVRLPLPAPFQKGIKYVATWGSLSACDEPMQQTQRTLRQYIANERLVYPTENSKFTYKILD
jgi:hypothetical protein